MADSVAFVAGSVFRIWSNFWQESQSNTSPIHLIKEGANSDFFFATAVPAKELNSFLEGAKNNNEFAFAEVGDWIVSPTVWLGHWSFFSATSRGKHNFIWDSSSDVTIAGLPDGLTN